MTAVTKKRAAFAAALAGVIAIVLASGGSMTDVANAMHRAINFSREAGPLAFFSAMALLPIFGFPLAPFVMTAGPAFGPTLGVPAVIACSLLAVTVNVALSYGIAARLLRPLMARLVTRLGYRLPAIEGQSAWIATLVLRVVPGPPFFLQSYLLGLVRVPFGIYLAVSVLVPLGYLSSIVLFGDALARGDRSAAVGACALMFVVGGVIHQLRKRFTSPPPPAGQS